MEHLINVHIEKLPEGVYLATSEDVQGLVAQGRTVVETLEIARDVARKLLEAQAERHSIEAEVVLHFFAPWAAVGSV
jgi:predicted RNase H-like HicB family nuclease